MSIEIFTDSDFNKVRRRLLDIIRNSFNENEILRACEAYGWYYLRADDMTKEKILGDIKLIRRRVNNILDASDNDKAIKASKFVLEFFIKNGDKDSKQIEEKMKDLKLKVVSSE